ncbi:MAG: hypothetical protein ACXVRZ_03585 [Gaiellaceae bacterium]
MIVRIATCVVSALILSAAQAQASPVPHGSISSAVPVLRNAAALGTLVRLDTKAAVAEFRVKRSWHYTMGLFGAAVGNQSLQAELTSYATIASSTHMASRRLGSVPGSEPVPNRVEEQ